VPERIAFQTESRVDELARLSSFETKQFKTIYESLLDKKDKLDHTPSIMPCEGYQTRGYGLMNHPITGFKQMHTGIDIANRTGTPICATAAGVVSYVGGRGRMGKTVEISHGNGIKTTYAHLNKCLVKRGQKVERGDKIAEMGSTGYSTGTHLHYAVSFNGMSVNPRKYILSPDLASN
jgi:murein DD-endopeptidase MepM/ murein hydrolase activator NlpD